MIAPAVRNAVAAASAAFALAFAASMDANPSLFLFDKFLVSQKRLKGFFEGRSILITGASSGIGAELAIQASRFGVKHLILTGRSKERLDFVANACLLEHNKDEQVKETGVASNDKGLADSTTIVSVLPLDMNATDDEFHKAIAKLEELLGNDQLDCVILNAGRGQLQPAHATSSSTISEIFRVNTLAPIALTQILLERGILNKEKGRHIVVTSSIAALVGVPLSSSYAASKWALHGYMKSLKSEMPWLRIDFVCPGPVDTSFHENHIGKSTVDTKELTKDLNVERNDGSEVDSLENKKHIQPKKMKMSLERCTRLYMSSMAKGTEGGEYWIAEQPTLFGLYINQYFPGLFQKILTRIGPLRMQAWKEGKDLYDPQTWKEVGKKK